MPSYMDTRELWIKLSTGSSLQDIINCDTIRILRVIIMFVN